MGSPRTKKRQEWVHLLRLNTIKTSANIVVKKKKSKRKKYDSCIFGKMSAYSFLSQHFGETVNAWNAIFACRDYYDSVLMRENCTLQIQALILACREVFKCSLEEREFVMQMMVEDLNEVIRLDMNDIPNDNIQIMKFACQSISDRLKQMTGRTCVPYCTCFTI